ncbi:hypothetical protein [Actinokineospora cianjurensis]|uniref:LPXTG-motif cell wall-anchored protein n=1 Tax=Actinokineospora cianjurensis TaxID=585224 RepID=A0A421AWN1_9PSEU|nr:hypothetical protein [Actinokineospora cianjurensis]RLK54094.1 hypothetical protein CLV68_6096 [Actinokineospora cianjurensis]
MRSDRYLVAALLAVLLGLLLPGTASAGRVGGLLVTPGESVDEVPVRLKTDKGCPQGSTGYIATMKGHGLDNVVVVPTSDVLLSHTQGFVVPVANTFRDYATDNKTTLQGKYEITLSCIDAFSQQNFGDFTAVVDIPSAGHYAAVGEAKGPARNTDPIIPPELGLNTPQNPAPTPQPGQAQPQTQAQPGDEQPDGEPVDTAAPAADGGSGVHPFLYLGGGVVVLVAAAAIAAGVRRRAATAAEDTETETE